MCQDYNYDDGAKKKSILRCVINWDEKEKGPKPKHFDLDATRVDYAIQQLRGIKGFINDIRVIN